MEHASNTLPLEHLVGSAELTLRLRKGLRDCRSSHPTNIDIYNDHKKLPKKLTKMSLY